MITFSISHGTEQKIRGLVAEVNQKVRVHEATKSFPLLAYPSRELPL